MNDIVPWDKCFQSQQIVGPPASIDVTIGGGELGRGFYMGDSIALSAAWARGRYGGSSAVIRAEIEDVAYAQLNIKVLSLVQVQTTWRQLRPDRTTRTYLFGVDVAYGPLATYHNASQHKFESQRAASLLTQSSWDVL